MTVCSIESRAASEPLPGTAPFARAWIVIESPGSWGREAVADSRLPEPVRAGQQERNVWVSRSVAGGMLLRHGLMSDLTPLATWDMEAIAAGSLPALGSVTHEPLLLVCTHGKRDRCCAVNGRALLTSLLDAAEPGQRQRIWECSHIGGHRFAPVTLSLPSGAVHGRLDTAQAAELLQRHESGRVLIDRLRGRSGFLAPCQTAAGAVRLATGIDAVDDLDVLRMVDDRAVPAAGGIVELDVARTEVRHRDGRAWRVDVERVPLDQLRAESCGAEPVAAAAWVVRQVTPAADWQ